MYWTLISPPSLLSVILTCSSMFGLADMGTLHREIPQWFRKTRRCEAEFYLLFRVPALQSSELGTGPVYNKAPVTQSLVNFFERVTHVAGKGLLPQHFDVLVDLF